MRILFATAALLLLAAPPAFADVVDLGAGWQVHELAAVREALAAISAEDFEIVIVPASPPDGLDAEAARQFAARGLNERQAVFAMTGDAKRLGVHLGRTFVEEGIEGEVLRNRIEVAFDRAAAEGRGRDGVIELARQLKVMRATGTAAPFRMPWGLIGAGAGGLAALGGAAWFRRRQGRRHALRDRLALVRSATARTAGARAGFEAAIDGRGRSGEAAALAARLMRLGEAAAAEATKVADGVRAAEGTLAKGAEAEVGTLALALEHRGFLAEAAMAAARSGLLALDAGEPVDAVTARLVAGEAAARDWQSVRAAIAWLVAHSDAPAMAQHVRETRLNELRALLTAVPVRLDEARQGLDAMAGQLEGVKVQRAPAGPAAADVPWDLGPARWLASASGRGTLPLSTSEG